ncbi:hypothetical protein G6F70_007979 [Rhizopus microsporus]|uniref:DUF7137 domain-containing protein n=1 Tax=Rhizopus microsporus TaxID=58291 RepID=A0A0A1MUI2_RHIZD|nr:hypothetical protein G6F71_006115 [Rhizopus microsporus]KAG1195773.1 hypothetical protein G6F70_007979 [Rhizopus microsporus]KAG1207644.1 hypothetical protein G6F69_007876 [Rhizopus microsporus]KAG1228551.1 hypothetical protein G6F67_007743 [Rhizopus microsporus]KAG1259519.1 hypothetical protein G6F68_008059 [Rhizopus microsporus]
MRLLLLQFVFLAFLGTFIKADLIKRVPQAAQTPAAPAGGNNGTLPASSTQAPAASVTPATSGNSTVVPSGNSTAPIPSGANNQTSIVNGNNTVSSNSSNTWNNLPTSASYGNTVYPGSATFLTPKPSKSVSPLYRIDKNENVTFVWSFTNLLVRPSNLTLAAVAPNSVTYTITAMQGAETSAVWHLKDVPPASPLMMGMYQIQLYDQRGPTAVAQPGWLAPANSLTIAFYSAESYIPPSGSDYCPTCFYNAGKRLSESIGPIAVAFGIASVTSVLILYGILY